MQATATVVGQQDDLRQAVQMALEQPGRQARQRAELRQLLSGTQTNCLAASTGSGAKF